MKTPRGKNPSKDCPASYQNRTLPTEWAQGACSCQSHNLQTWGKGEGRDSQLLKRKETPFWHQFMGRAKSSSHALSEQVASSTCGGGECCGILGLVSRHGQVCRVTHNQCRQRCAHKNHSTGLTNLWDSSPRLCRGTLRQGGTFGLPSYSSEPGQSPAKHRGVPASTPNPSPLPEILCTSLWFGRTSTCERGRRSCPRAVCSVAGAGALRNICMGTAGTAAHSWTGTQTSTSAVITVWAVPHCPPDTQMGPTKTIFYPLHWCCWQGDRKLQNSLQPFIHVLLVSLSPWPFCFGIHILPNIHRPLLLHYGKTRTYMNRYSESRHALNKEQGSLELISVWTTASFSGREAHFDPSE